MSIGDYKAFPMHPASLDNSALQKRQGMTLRQYYIGCALTGLLAYPNEIENIEAAAIRVADNLISLLDAEK